MDFHFEGVKDVLVCPKSNSQLVYDGKTLVCVNPECRLQYQIKEGIPIMLVDDATELSTDDWSAVMSRHPDVNSQPETPTGE